MGPEDVFNASKVIAELAEVQKKAASLTKKLEKENKMNKTLEREINGIEHLDEMNETINMYKEKKTSALELASQNGTVDSIDQLKSGDSFDAVLKRSKFKMKKDLIASIAVVMVNEVSNALKNQCQVRI